MASSNLTGGSPLRQTQQISSNQIQDEQMQTASESNAVFSNLPTVGNLPQRNSSATSLQNQPMSSGRTMESVTDDEDLPQVNPLQRESSSEGVSNFVKDLRAKNYNLFKARSRFVQPFLKLTYSSYRFR